MTESVNMDQIAQLPDNIQVQNENVEQTNVPGGVVSGDTKIASVQDLQTKAPQLYNAILMGLASSWRGQQERSNDRIKKNLQESNRR